MTAAEWFAAARAMIAAHAAARDRAEAARAALECGAIRYDSQPGGGGVADPVGDLIELEAELADLEARANAVFTVGGRWLWGVGGASAALGALPADACGLYYLLCMSWGEVARTLDVSKSWAMAQAARCLRWVDAQGARLPEIGQFLDCDR
jgi:hypothetical protein